MLLKSVFDFSPVTAAEKVVCPMMIFWKHGGPHGVAETKLVSFKYLSETSGGGGLHPESVKLATISSASSTEVFLIMSLRIPWPCLCL
jgi:hypothetical protein